MKARRQTRIVEIIRETPVHTQQQLAAALRREGMDVTQATVSRDIKELRLVKVPAGDGRYRYALPDESTPGHVRRRLSRLLRECVVDLDGSENLIVVKTLSGTASACGEAIDAGGWPEVIGTVAGDNTLLLVVKPKEAVEQVLRRLHQALGS